jgi:pterin-4a-carbinolamine dehydratase
MTDQAPYLFISYRRDDTQWIARALYRHLAERFGSQRVFVDRVEIRGGDDWRGKIDIALREATSVLAIIGQQWLTLTDHNRRLRIDKENDWVRNEIRTAIAHGKLLIPLYVDGARIITDKEQLPSDIWRLTEAQGVELSDNYWDAGLREVVRRLEFKGFRSYDPSFPMPEKRKKVEALSRGQLEEALTNLQGWTVTATYVSTGRGDPPLPRNELYKEYRFHSFCDATKFMAAISPTIDAGQHHPRWENIWTTVRVWLSTWDIEFQPSLYDVRLAQTLDDAFEDYRKRA